MKKHFIALFLTGFAFQTSVFSQNIDAEDLKYKYARLPLKPLPKDVKGYTSKIELAYESKNQELKVEYKEKLKQAEEKYKQDLIEYDKKDKEAEAKYQKELAEYNKKSTGSKVAQELLLKQSNKPTKQYVPKPYKDGVAQSESAGADFNKDLLATTYLKLEGYSPSGANAVKILGSISGFEMNEPEKVTSEQTKVVNGTSSTTKKYKYKLQYKQPITLKVEGASGVLMEETVEGTNNFSESLTAEFDSESALESNWSGNQTGLKKKYETEITNKNLKLANEQLNSNFGFSTLTRETKLYTIKDKKGIYPDITEAYTTAQQAFNTLDAGFKKEAIVEISKSVEAWEKAMTESNPKDKKARIDADVTIAILFNLIEGYNLLENYPSALKYLIKLKGMDLSRREKDRVEGLSSFISDQKMRFEASQQN